MIKYVVLAKRKEGMNREEFIRYWVEKHAPLSKKIPGLRKYVVSASLRHEDQYDGMAELWFDDQEALGRGFSSAEGQTALKDVVNFHSKDRIVIVTQESVIV